MRSISVLVLALGATGGLGGCENDPGNAARPPVMDAGPSGDGAPPGRGCSTPKDLDAAMAELPERRPCWAWLDAEAARLPRKVPRFWRTLYFDVLRFNRGTPSDHTAESVAFQSTLLAAHPWVNLAPIAPIAPPWARPTPPFEEIAWPFTGSNVDDSGSDRDEKLRGIATTVLHARSKGLAYRVSIMLQRLGSSASGVRTLADADAYVDATVLPQLEDFARMAERTHAEYMGLLSLEADGLVDEFEHLPPPTAADRRAFAQRYLTAAAARIRAVYTGRVVPSLTVLNLGDDATDPSFDLQGYDELQFTMQVPCADDPSPRSPISGQLDRVRKHLDRNPGKPWSIAELQVPYAICGAARAESFRRFRTAVDAFDRAAPVGVGLALAPVTTPADDLDATSLSEMGAWLSAK